MSFVYIFATILCVSFLVEAVPAPGHGVLKGYCKTNAHCSRNECCVRFDNRRGRRDTLRSDLKKYVDGKCEKPGRFRSSCLLANNYQSDIYYHSCPCGRDMQCVDSKQTIVPVGKMGKCLYTRKG